MTWAETWDAQAETFEDARRAAWAETGEDAATLSHLLRLSSIPAAGTVLDLGAGWGRLSIPMARSQPRLSVLAVDVSPRMIEHLTEQGAGVSNLHPLLCDGERLPPVPSLAGAWSMLTFQHVPAAQQRSYLGQIADRLRPAAPLIVQFVTDTEPGPLSHPVTATDIIAWARAVDLVIEEIDDDATHPTWLWLHARKARFQ